MHTDRAYVPRPPRYIVMMCIVPDDGGDPEVADGGEALAMLDADAQRELVRTAVRLSPGRGLVVRRVHRTDPHTYLDPFPAAIFFPGMPEARWRGSPRRCAAAPGDWWCSRARSGSSTTIACCTAALALRKRQRVEAALQANVRRGSVKIVVLLDRETVDWSDPQFLQRGKRMEYHVVAMPHACSDT